MEKKKISFFSRIKRAIVNFDEYQNFSMEKLSLGVKYFLKLMLLFSLILAFIFTYKTYTTIEKMVTVLQESFPDFRVEDNELVLENVEVPYIIQGENNYVGVILDNQKAEIENTDYQILVAMLKDKIIIKNKALETFGVNSITYKDFQDRYNIESLNKQDVLNYIGNLDITGFLYSVFIAMFIYNFIIYLLLALIDVVLVSILGFLVSRVFRMQLKYKPILIMSFYAMTLPIILSLIYYIVNLLTGFDIKYFNVAYDAISYIYIVTAILMIKSDLIKQQMELIKIAEVQKQVREEMDRKKEEKKEEEEKKRKEKEKEQEKEGKDPENETKGNPEKKEKKKKEPKPKVEPEGSQAIVTNNEK